MNEDFITTDKSKAFIDKVGKDYIIIQDLETNEKIKIDIMEDIAIYFKNECSDGDIIYVLYDKEKKELI